jgi:predicted nucleic acid-binding Zn ribbon protein
MSAFLKDAARSLGVSSALDLSLLQGQWVFVVGPELARHCRPVALERGVLVVVADHGAWAAELRFHAGSILARAASLVDGVSSVSVRVDPFSA